MKQNCPACSEPVNEDAHFCPRCGNTYFPWQDSEDQGGLGVTFIFLGLFLALTGHWMWILSVFICGLGVWLLIPKRRKKR
jgi:hypothetical protein